MKRRDFLKATIFSALSVALAPISARASSWMPWTRMTAIALDGRTFTWPARRVGSRRWVSTMPFDAVATLIGCRTPFGSYRWFTPIHLLNGDSMEFTYTTDLDLPMKLPDTIPEGWRDERDQGEWRGHWKR